MRVNLNNFGFGNTAGGFSTDACNDVFLEADGEDCLGLSSCTGVCVGFQSTTCPLASYLGGDSTNATAPSSAPKAPAVLETNKSNESASKNLTPIIVATVVSAFVFFGFIAIIFSRRKNGRTQSGVTLSNSNISDGNVSGSKLMSVLTSRCGALKAPCCCRKKRSNYISAEGFDDDEA